MKWNLLYKVIFIYYWSYINLGGYKMRLVTVFMESYSSFFKNKIFYFYQHYLV